MTTVWLISGKAAAGKDQAGSILQDLLPAGSAERLSFAAELKRVANCIWQWDDDPNSYARKAARRMYLIQLAMAVREINPDSWAQIVRRTVELHLPEHAIVTDWRFENERLCLAESSDVSSVEIIRITASEDVRRQRMRDAGTSWSEYEVWAGHKSECSLDHLDHEADITVQNNGTIEELRSALRQRIRARHVPGY